MKANTITKPLILFIRVTENCNASCFMCGFGKNKNQLYISDKSINDIIKQSKKAGIKLVRFTGGEPLLHSSLSSFIKAFKKEGFKVSVITNAFLLPAKSQELVDAGLDQVIVSLDGSNAQLHDKLRNLPGLFDNAVKGIKTIKSHNKKILVRVNTVISQFNIGDIENILDLINTLNVDQWSIIPLKVSPNPWKDFDREKLLTYYNNFKNKIANITKPWLLGYSGQWAGRNDSEINNFFDTGIPFTPKDKCFLAGLVRFYVPFSDRLTPCNCAAWRIKNAKFNTKYGIKNLTGSSISPFVEYFQENGPEVCQGCEPINAYLGEHPEILKENIFSF